MREYTIELSKYLIAAFIVMYTLISFCYFGVKSKGVGRGILVMQNILMLAVQFFCFLTLALVSGDSRYLFFFAFIQIFLFTIIFVVTLLYDNVDRLLLNHMCMLMGLGLCMISRLSGVGGGSSLLVSRAVRQFIIMVGSVLVSLLIPFLFSRGRFWKKLTWGYASLGILILSLVYALGSVTHGSKISFTVGGITFQPSEFVKILFLFFLAAALWDKVSFPRIVLTAILAGIHVIVLAASRDLGSALIFFVVYVMIVFVATGNYFYLAAGAAGGVLASVFAYRIFDHVKVRVLAWKEPWTYIDDQGYQVTQSLFAVGSGNWFGMGLLRGAPRAIPYVEVDMIFSAICEEMGVIAGICLILICFCVFWEIMRIALRISDRFYQLIVYGAGVLYIFQTFLTVGGGIKFIPLTGVTLPFISYGGSSVMSSMILFFVVQAIYIRLLEQEEKQRIKQEEASDESADREMTGEGEESVEAREPGDTGREMTEEGEISVKAKEPGDTGRGTAEEDADSVKEDHDKTKKE